MPRQCNFAKSILGVKHQGLNVQETRIRRPYMQFIHIFRQPEVMAGAGTTAVLVSTSTCDFTNLKARHLRPLLIDLGPCQEAANR